MDAAEQRRIDAGNDIDLKWLRSFVVVAEEASFTRAATRVHVAQPGVSAQVRRLESELGQQLLDRSGRSVRLTEVGSAVDSGHPLADSGTVTVRALRDLPLVSLPRGTGVRAALDVACAEAGFTPRIVLEASALPMVVQLAALGLGLAVVPASAANAPRILQITNPQIRSRLELIWNAAASANPAARVLIEHAKTLTRPAPRSPLPPGS